VACFRSCSAMSEEKKKVAGKNKELKNKMELDRKE
jgi:hypothetical protein